MKRFRVATLSQVLFLLCFCPCGQADPLDTWVQRSPLPTSEDILGVTYAAGEFLASAGIGGILSSPDGVSWVVQPLAATILPVYSVTGLAYGNGQYVAVGFQGQVLTSSNRIDWTPQWSGVTTPLLSVAYGLGRFVAVGGGMARTIVTSEDGIHWTVRRLSNEGDLWQVVFSQNAFYAVGNSGAILSSGDGANWRQFTAPRAARLNGIANGDGRLVVVGEFGQYLTSTNGFSWTTNGPVLQSGFPTVAYGGGRFVIVDGGRVWVSTNGLAWVVRGAVGLSSVSAITYGAGEFVAVGSHGFVATSVDGFQWTSHSSGTNVLFRQVAAGGGTVLATGDGSMQVGPNVYQMTTPLLKTRDGTAWSASGIDPIYQPIGVAFANGQFIVFTRDNRNPPHVVVMTSSDGSTWARNDIGSAGAASRVIYANGQYLAVGGGIFNSPDGRHWTTQPAVTSNGFSGVAYGNGRYVAVGAENVAFVSTTGTNWSSRPTGTNWLTDIAFGNGQFVAIGNGYLVSGNGSSLISSGEILTSSDGEHWTQQTTPFGPETGTYLGGIAFGAGWFVIVGGGGVILTSPDGMRWTSHILATKEPLVSVAYDDGAFVAVGPRGTTVFSGNILAATLGTPAQSPAGFSFSVTGQRGQIYHVQAATDLNSSNWTELGIVTNETGSVVFLDSDRGGTRARFYRVVNP